MDYVEEWPKFCRDCGGYGAATFIENGAPHGCGFWPMEVQDDCPSCIGKGICPRCGTLNYDDWVDDEVPCPECGWVFGMPGTAALPEDDPFDPGMFEE